MKVGDYVRTENGHIDKIIKISDEMKSGRTIKVEIGEEDIIGGYKDFVDWFNPSHFIKSSPNIIDLIEVGDYVNGQKVFDKLYDELNKCWYLKLEIGEVFGKYARTYQQHIKSIVTHEQFERMQYNLESEVN